MKMADLMFIYVGVAVVVIIIDRLNDRRKKKKAAPREAA